jgi:hypothetical protein
MLTSVRPRDVPRAGVPRPRPFIYGRSPATRSRPLINGRSAARASVHPSRALVSPASASACASRVRARRDEGACESRVSAPANSERAHERDPGARPRVLSAARPYRGARPPATHNARARPGGLFSSYRTHTRAYLFRRGAENRRRPVSDPGLAASTPHFDDSSDSSATTPIASSTTSSLMPHLPSPRG